MEDAKELGSLATRYYNEYKDNLEMFGKLILLELIRLSLIPMERRNKDKKVPSLHFVKRFLNVEIKSTELAHNRFKAYLDIKSGVMVSYGVVKSQSLYYKHNKLLHAHILLRSFLCLSLSFIFTQKLAPQHVQVSKALAVAVFSHTSCEMSKKGIVYTHG